MSLTTRIVDHILQVEGGYSHDPNDPGGETKWGISKRSYPHLDIAALTEADAREIYERDYVQPVLDCVKNDRLAFLVADSAVNHGLTRALAWLEDAPSFDAYVSHRIRFYTSLTTLWPHYGRGWMNRLAQVVAAADEHADASSCRVTRVIDTRDVMTRVLAALHGTAYPQATRVETRAGERTLILS